MANSSNFSSDELSPETMGDSVVLPPEIITEIISRLPVKPLLRFRCVSKPWCYLIDSKEFAKQHLKQSVISSTNFNLMLGFTSIFSFSLDSVHLTGLISYDNVERLPLPPFPGSLSVMLNSCNGLILIKNTEVSHLYIWNPFTRKYKELPDPRFEYPVGPLVADENYAFAYISETDEYKVVKVVEFSRFVESGVVSWLSTETKIFSSTSNEWEKIENFPYRLGYNRVWGAHKDGILHTVVKNGSSVWSIMGFDVRSKQHALVPSPDLGVSAIVCSTVEVLGGYLCSINLDFNGFRIDVWVMKDYGVKDSWSKLVSVALEPFKFIDGLIGYSGSLQPVAYSKDGEEVLLNKTNKQLYWYNLRTGIEREVTINTSSVFYFEVCFESLVSFPGFISVGNVKGESEIGLKKN